MLKGPITLFLTSIYEFSQYLYINLLVAATLHMISSIIQYWWINSHNSGDTAAIFIFLFKLWILPNAKHGTLPLNSDDFRRYLTHTYTKTLPHWLHVKQHLQKFLLSHNYYKYTNPQYPPLQLIDLKWKRQMYVPNN